MFNLKLAFRTLRKTPFVTLVAALSLALGIGSNTAIYSIFDQMLRRPLPVYHADELINLTAPGPKPGSQSCGNAGDCDAVFTYAMMRDLQKAPLPLTGIAGHNQFGINLAFEKQVMNGEGELVSGSYFPVLGISAAMGRLIGPADDETVGGHPVVVLAYAFWETRLGADPSVVNKTMTINGREMTIIGVAPQGFEGTTMGSRPLLYVPISMRPAMGIGTVKGLENRRNYWVYLFARRKPGVSIAQAKAAIDAAYSPIINNVEASLQVGMSDATLKLFKARTVGVEDGRRGQSTVQREASTPLAILFSITGIVLLIACANIANLLLAKAANRELEMAVRLSLGASRRQLLQQLLTESVVLAAIGGVLSFVFAQWTLGGISALLPGEISETMHFQLRWSAVLFAGVLSLLTGIAFGLFPALHSTRPDLVTAMRNSSGKLAGGRAASRFRSTLATAQIALSMALLMSAGLFVKSLWNVSRLDLGVKVDNVVTFGISPARNGYDTLRSAAMFDRVVQEVAALPGVNGVTSATVPLLSGSNWGNDVSVEGFKRDPDTDANSRFNEIGADYFKTLGVPMLAGREFTEADGAGRPLVAVVNEAFAKKFGLGHDVVGKRMARGDTNVLDIEIVGLVKDVKYSQVKAVIPPLFYIPHRQDGRLGFMNFYVRTPGDPNLILRSIPGAIRRLDPNLPVEDLKTMPEQIRENVFMDRMISTLSASFALLATILAAIGLYGVLAYSVAQRTREIGVRMALGASSGAVRIMVLRQVGLMVLIGGVIGIAGAIGMAKGAASILFQISGADPLVMAAAVMALSLVSLGAGYVPARRASKIDPMQALRYE
ncbi:MAG TPA: ABC transporter permease [Gemmatimonadaceae bacterium]